MCVCVCVSNNAGVQKGRRWAVDDPSQEAETSGGEGAIVRTEWGWRQYSQLFCTRDDAKLWCVCVWPLPSMPTTPTCCARGSGRYMTALTH